MKMSQRLAKSEDATGVRWNNQFRIEISDDLPSISSEEESASEFDNERPSRVRPLLDTWETHYIWTKLQGLPEAEEIVPLITSENTEKLLHKNPSTVILIASWMAKENILKTFHENGFSLRVFDDSGRTPLHLAAIAGNAEVLKFLLHHGCDIEAKDAINKATALHCAASKGHLVCVRILVKHGADVNSGLTHKSPLHYAVQSGAVECVRELLEQNATPNTPQVFSETPLHVAASIGSAEMVKLLLDYGAAVNVQCGPEKYTPLHMACEDGDLLCARLLLDAGAQIAAENNKKQTALHLAALAQSAETLELLLSRGANPNVRDVDGRTPLHGAIVKVSRSCECARLLLSARADVNQQDNFGYTPMHLAALNEFSNCVMLLLNHGGDVTIRTNGGVSVLTFITRKTPDVIPKYISKFDSAIKLNDHELGDVDCELKLDFRILVPTMGNKETELLLNFIEVGHREILKHPLCDTFIFLKWRRIRKFFLFSLFYHSLFTFLYTVYVIGVFLKDCPPPKLRGMWETCRVNTYINVFGYLLLCLNGMLMIKEVFQICHSWRIYVKQWENWLQWLIIVSVASCVQPTHSMDIKVAVTIWQHHVAAIGIFLAWLELLMIVGRFPIFGLYIQMFTTVAINFFKFIAAYLCLLIAFGLSFGVLFANYKSFKDLKWVIIKVIVMMSGELEYEDIFYDDSAQINYVWTAQIMFLAYVILVTVILTNLMVGLAVSDIQGLQQSAGLDRLVRQAELVAHLESMLFSRLLKCFPEKLMGFFHKKALLLKSQHHWALYIRPNDPREERIPKELIKSIYQLVAARKERPKIKTKKNTLSDLLSPPLSRLNSNCSSCGGLDRSFKSEFEDICREFTEFSQSFMEKIERINAQMGRNKSN